MQSSFNFRTAILLLVLSSSLIDAQNSSFIWARAAGGFSADAGNQVVADNTGNVYHAGYYKGTCDFNTGSGVYTVTASNNTMDLFISKHTPSGTFLWAKTMGGTSDEEILGMTVDNNCNIYITGYYIAPFDIDPGPGTYTMAQTGSGWDIFIAKFDSAGVLQWAHGMGTSGSNSIGHDVAVDQQGNVYVTGEFNASVDFDPSPSTTFSMTSSGLSDIFVLKLNAAGQFIWARKMGGAGRDIGHGIITDSQDMILSTGEFSATVDFDPGSSTYNLVSAGLTDVFVSKLDPSGNFVWAGKMGGVAYDIGFDVALDGADNVIAGGYFYGSADFDPSPASSFSLNAPGNYDPFICKLSSSGTFSWAVSFGGGSADGVMALTADAGGNVYSTGFLTGAGDLDPGASTYTLPVFGGQDVFLQKLDAAGTFVWAKVFGSSNTNQDYGNDVALDAFDNVYVTGFYSGTTDFNPGTATFTISPVGGTDMYLSKFCQMVIPSIQSSGPPVFCQGGTVTLSSSAANTYSWSNGASSSVITVSTSGNYSLTAYRADGCTAPSAVFSVVVNPAPVVVLNSGLICAGQSFTFSPAGAMSYTFLNGGTVVTPAATTTYSVIGESQAGCVSLAPSTAVITVANLPTVSVNSGTVCSGNSFTIVPSGATSYSINGNSYVVKPSSTTNYSVSGFGPQGCKSATHAIATVSVLQIPLPVIVAASGGICPGGSFTISPSGASTYTYSSGGNIVSPQSTSVFSVTGTNAAGCISNVPAVLTVSVYALPNVTAQSSRNRVCEGDEFTLSAEGASTYSWSNGLSGQSVTATLSASAFFTVTGVDLNGCTNEGVTLVVLDPCTGLNTQEVSSVKVFPNPAGDHFFIQVDGAFSATLYDVSGRVVISGAQFTQQGVMDVSALAPGIYMLQVVKGSSVFTQRVLAGN